MRVDVTPRQAAIIPGQEQPISITVTNTGTVIGGYAIRVLGADPGWVTLDADQLSLFPDETRTLLATITPPRGIPAGSRRIAIQVRELTPPEASTITELDLTVPAAKSLQMRVDPLAVTAGRRATFSLIVENAGNTQLNGQLAGDDPESKVAFAFEPERVALAPGEHAVVDMRAKARRHITGSPTVRMLGVYLDELPPEPFFDGPDPDAPAPARGERDALANATFIQRSVLSRGPLSLVGLLAAVTVFAIVITIALSRLVGQTTADRNLALQVAAARNQAAASGTSGISGTVRLLTLGKPVANVTVSVFNASDTTNPIATTATSTKGSYQVANLAAGKYKISFRGAGFVQLWYPGAASDADAATLTLDPKEIKTANVSLGGVPATISGTVVGEDVSAATLYLETLPIGTSATSATTTALPAAAPGVNTPPDNGSAIVQTVPIGTDGSFALSGVPSPSVYELVIVKTGYATSTQRIDIGAGENRSGVQLRLDKGDGVIAGTVSSGTGPLDGVTITATSGQSTASTVSVNVGQLGSFTLRSLPTPATFTIVASKAEFATQTLTLTLAAGQKLTGVAITLSKSAGTLKGTVTQLPGNAGAAGVSVTVTDGLLTVQTATESTGSVGSWQVGGLPVPGTYTVTFTRPDLAAQTVSVSLDAGGNITPGSFGATITAAGITVGMQSATSTVFGTVAQQRLTGGAAQPLGEATVTLNSGTSSYTLTTASVPAPSSGRYRFDNVPPGTYTLTVSAGSGTSPHSEVVTLHAGDQPLRKDVRLLPPASMSGTVVRGGVQLCDWTVLLYRASQYPTVITEQQQTVASAGKPCGFTFAGIDADTYIIEARPSPGSPPAASIKITVTPSEQLTGGNAVRFTVPG